MTFEEWLERDILEHWVVYPSDECIDSMRIAWRASRKEAINEVIAKLEELVNE